MLQSQRIEWVDYAKGISIILVVMMHSTLSTEETLGHAGWLHGVVEFARPFRIPAFFMIAGLFVAHTIDRDWRTFLDRKVLHFVYFYVLWLVIQFAFRAPFYVADQGTFGALKVFLTAFIDPYGTLWFIYLLPVFFLATRLTRSIPPAIVFLVAAALEIAPIETQWTLIDEFAGRFVYFYSGYLFSTTILRSADWSRSHTTLVLTTLAAWFVANLLIVHAGLSTQYGISLALGFAGAAAVIAISVLLARSHLFEGLRYCATFQRLAVMFRLREGVETPVHFPQHTVHPHVLETVRPVFVKLFKNVPKMDVDMLLPGTRVKMTWLDHGRIMLPTLSGLALAALKIIKGAVIFTFVSVYGTLALLGFVGGTLLYGLKSFFGYLHTKDKYHLHLTRSLYYQNLDNNAGVFTRLLQEAEEQELREALLAYAMLRSEAERGCTAGELDRLIEAWLHAQLGTLVDFEVHDALHKLLKWELCEKLPNERYVAVPAEEALRLLDARWDGWFKT